MGPSAERQVLFLPAMAAHPIQPRCRIKPTCVFTELSDARMAGRIEPDWMKIGSNSISNAAWKTASSVSVLPDIAMIRIGDRRCRLMAEKSCPVLRSTGITPYLMHVLSTTLSVSTPITHAISRTEWNSRTKPDLRMTTRNFCGAS